MAISETQLTTWSNIGSIKQSSDTYATIKRSLESTSAGYVGKNFDIFLQGSYGNSTNIYGESDVDVVIRLKSIFQYSLDGLSNLEKLAFEHSYSGGGGSYTSTNFKSDVIAALKKSFGTDVTVDKKAIKIKANGTRRDADVIAAIEYRDYSSFPNIASAVFKSGICFYTDTSQKIINFPQQHSSNCTRKHKDTNQYFKPMIRILKNMRSKLIDNGAIKKNEAPSYYIEGLLYNVPNEKFGSNYASTFINAINWINEADSSNFVCANEHFYLIRDTQWPSTNYDKFMKEIIKLWHA